MKIDFQKIKTTIKEYPKIRFIVCMLLVLTVGFIAGRQYDKNQLIDYSPSSTAGLIYDLEGEKNDTVKENEDTTVRKNDAINIKLLKRDFVEMNYSESLYFEFQYTNKTEQTIKAFKGTVMFYDIFNEMLLSVEIEYLKPIKPGETVTEDGYWDYNPYIADNVKFKDQPDEDVSYKVNISEILYLDEPEQVTPENNNLPSNIK